MTSDAPAPGRGLDLGPMRATRFAADGPALAARLSPPYDVIDDAQRSRLLESSPRNVVELILPSPGADGRPDYDGAAQRLARDVADGTMAVDADPALYVYEMAGADGRATRGLVGAVRLHEADEGVIFPHENVMAGPVADRLALMEAAQANLEPIYLIYQGGGAAADAVARVSDTEPVAEATTPDGTRHRLWAVVEPAAVDAIRADLARRTAVIADGHHRYATYLELRRRADGPGPWDRGLTLLVDSTQFGPQVEAIHRVVPDLDFAAAIGQAQPDFAVDEIDSADLAGDPPAVLGALDALDGRAGEFAAVVTDGVRAALVHRPRSGAGGEPEDLLADLDVTVVHSDLVQGCWSRPDTVDALQYAHSAADAIAAARAERGVAVLLRPTPVEAVLAIAGAGLRMPRKSTLFVPKPASGLVLRRFADQPES